MKSGFIRPADITSFSKDQMLTNTALNFAGGAGVNAVLSSKTANVLGNKIANVYRGIKEVKNKSLIVTLGVELAIKNHLQKQ